MKDDAEALRLGLAAGLIDAEEAVAWADQMILAGRSAEAPAVLDVALAVGKPVAELITLLGEVPGEPDPVAVGRRLASQLRRGLLAGELDVVTVARAMYRFVLEGVAPDREFEHMAYAADDGVDLALQGTYGTLDQVRQDVAIFLARYESSRPGMTPPAA